MRKKAPVLFVIFFFAMLLMQGCGTASNVPMPKIVTVKATTYAVITQIVSGTISPPPPTPTPPVSDPDGVFVSLSVDTRPSNPVQMNLGQKLYVISPAGPGAYGWILSFDQSFFRFDSKNEPQPPAQGWWIWTPLRTGQSTIEIKEVPPPCINANPPCTIPEYFARINVVVDR